MDPRNKLPRGTLEHLILRGISRIPQHGYALARWIEQRSEGGILIEEGSLYPAMHRLERAGYLSSSWGKAESGRRAKIYSITSRGQGELVDRNERWRELTSAIALVLRCAFPTLAAFAAAGAR
ncbi:MAG: PadR family transcriptional regulator [Planctomycetota bacterium]|nr:PadR family transcriptional regulator [Planctomycetota bacterium]MDG1984012.1 PadR family transcriptional regulator [Planctomycetota bacterium]